jgi:hypothetical protein
MVAGLGGFANVFAPGAGIEASLNSAFSNYDKAKLGLSPHAASSGDLSNAVEDLKKALARLPPAQEQVAMLLKSVNVSAVSAALKKCDVVGAAAPITLTPAELGFDANSAATRGFAISGGTPPYTVSALDVLPDGISLVWDGGFAESAQVKVTATAPTGDVRLQVGDSGTVKRKQQLMVHVVNKPAKAAENPAQVALTSGAGNQPAAQPPTAAMQDWNDLIASMIKPTFKKKLGSVEISVSSAVIEADRLKVTLSCGNAKQELDPTKVRDLLKSANVSAANKLIAANKLDSNLSQFDLTPSASCVKQ